MMRKFVLVSGLVLGLTSCKSKPVPLTVAAAAPRPGAPAEVAVEVVTEPGAYVSCFGDPGGVAADAQGKARIVAKRELPAGKQTVRCSARQGEDRNGYAEIELTVPAQLVVEGRSVSCRGRKCSGLLRF